MLDYGVDWKLQEHAVLVVAQPDGRIPFVNVTFAGFIGSVSGMNDQQVSIGEMGGSGQGKWAGSPMAFLVRRVLEEAKTLDDAIQIFKTSKRTCEYYYVVADAKATRPRGSMVAPTALPWFVPANLIRNCRRRSRIRCCCRKANATKTFAALRREC